MNRIRILATSDIHGYIFPYNYASKDELNMGLSKVSSVIKKYKDENTIVIDNGDTLEGSPLMMYHYQKYPKDINCISKAFNITGYDYVNIGNHDFNYGKEALLKHLNYINAKCITVNIKNLEYCYDIKTINNKKIGIFGVITHYVPNWESPKNIEGLVFKDAFETAKKTVKILKEVEKVDYVVCVYHGGFEKDLESKLFAENETGENQGFKMIEEIKGIDILISGHQHRSISQTVNGVVISQTTSNGKEVACIDIYEDKIESYLIPCDLQADESINQVCEIEEECQKWLDETLGITNVDLLVLDETNARINKHQLITFLNIVSMHYGESDLSGTALFNGAKGFKKEITIRDLVTTYVYPNTLVVKEISGKVLKEYLEKNAEFFDIKNDEIIISEKYTYPKLQYYNYDMVDGISYTIKVSNEIGNRIVDIKFKGNNIKEEDVFTITLNNYRASGGGDFDMIKSLKIVKEINLDMVELLKEYISKFKVIDFEEINNINIIK